MHLTCFRLKRSIDKNFSGTEVGGRERMLLVPLICCGKGPETVPYPYTFFDKLPLTKKSFEPKEYLITVV